MEKTQTFGVIVPYNSNASGSSSVAKVDRSKIGCASAIATAFSDGLSWIVEHVHSAIASIKACFFGQENSQRYVAWDAPESEEPVKEALVPVSVEEASVQETGAESERKPGRLSQVLEDFSQEEPLPDLTQLTTPEQFKAVAGRVRGGDIAAAMKLDPNWQRTAYAAWGYDFLQALTVLQRVTYRRDKEGFDKDFGSILREAGDKGVGQLPEQLREAYLKSKGATLTQGPDVPLSDLSTMLKWKGFEDHAARWIQTRVMALTDTDLKSELDKLDVASLMPVLTDGQAAQRVVATSLAFELPGHQYHRTVGAVKVAHVNGNLRPHGLLRSGIPGYVSKKPKQK